jgi:predicted ATPase
VRTPEPTREEVQDEYEIVWKNLAGRSIESLVDMPLMTDPEIHAAMRVLSFLTGPALYTDINLYYLTFCKMVLSLMYGTSDASTFGYGGFGVILCLPFQRYGDGYRFAKLARDLVEKYGSGENLRSAWTSSVKENTGTPPKLSSASNNSSAISGARLRTFLPSATPTLTNGALKLS